MSKKFLTDVIAQSADMPAAAAGPAVRLPGAPPYPSPFDQEPAA